MKVQLAVGLVITLVSLGLLHSEDSKPNGYDVKESEKYAAYSFAAFCPQQCIESWTCRLTSPYAKLTNVTYVVN